MFWYLPPFLGIALVLALTLKQIPLSDTAGMVALGDAVGGEEAAPRSRKAVRHDLEAQSPEAQRLDVPLPGVYGS